MSNTFNISVKPEIAAVKTVVDANSVILVDVHDTDLPAAVTAIGNNLTAIGANNIILADLHDTDLPAVASIVTAIQTNQFFGFLLDDAVLMPADTERSASGTSWTKLKEIFITLPGIYRTTFDLKTGPGGGLASGRIYKNGVGHGTTHTNNTTSYVEKSDDLIFNTHDLVQLYVKADTIPHEAFIRNFKLKGVATTLPGFVITD